MVVVTFSGVPRLGGRVIGGSTGWILEVTKVSLTSEVRRDDLPTDSSPHIAIRTMQSQQLPILARLWICHHTCSHDPS